MTRLRIPAMPAVFGSADGLTLVLGLVAGLVLSRQTASAAWHASLSGGLAELSGMTLGQYWSAKQDGFLAAAVCGVSGCLSAIVPGLPFAVAPGSRTLDAVVSLALLASIAAVVCWLRPEHGWAAVGQTYGLLVLAGGLCAAAAVV